jgi:hypothetical protein
MQGLECRRVQCDEIWNVGKKQARLRPEERYLPGIGDQYVFIALDAETKLVPCFEVGKRNMNTGNGPAPAAADPTERVRRTIRPPRIPLIASDGLIARRTGLIQIRTVPRSAGAERRIPAPRSPRSARCSAHSSDVCPTCILRLTPLAR